MAHDLTIGASPREPDDEQARIRAVARLFQEHYSALLRFLLPRLRSEQEARDVAQEAYVRMLELDSSSAVSFLRGYLFKIAANLATDHRRQHAAQSRIHA